MAIYDAFATQWWITPTRFFFTVAICVLSHHFTLRCRRICWKWIRKDKQKRKILLNRLRRWECFLKHVSVVHNIACRKIWDKYPASNNIASHSVLVCECCVTLFCHLFHSQNMCQIVDLHGRWESEKKMKHMQNICFQCQKTFYSSLDKKNERPYAFSRFVSKASNFKK